MYVGSGILGCDVVVQYVFPKECKVFIFRVRQFSVNVLLGLLYPEEEVSSSFPKSATTWPLTQHCIPENLNSHKYRCGNLTRTSYK
jgi:hypothetical protein